MRRLIEGKEYQFRVLAENLYGTSDPCEESDSVLIQEAKIDIDYDKLGLLIQITFLVILVFQVCKRLWNFVHTVINCTFNRKW